MKRSRVEVERRWKDGKEQKWEEKSCRQVVLSFSFLGKERCMLFWEENRKDGGKEEGGKDGREEGASNGIPASTDSTNWKGRANQMSRMN